MALEDDCDAGVGRGDPSAGIVVKSYAKRLATIMNVEQGWRNEAYDQTVGCNDAVVDRFDAGNETEVCNTIVMLANECSYNPVGERQRRFRILLCVVTPARVKWARMSSKAV